MRMSLQSFLLLKAFLTFSMSKAEHWEIQITSKLSKHVEVILFLVNAQRTYLDIVS